jgi:hypothetical protein
LNECIVVRLRLLIFLKVKYHVMNVSEVKYRAIT